MTLSRPATRDAMTAFSLQWNIWGCSPTATENVDYWQQALTAAGMNDGNSDTLCKAFCLHWQLPRKPTLHDIASFVRGQSGVQTQSSASADMTPQEKRRRLDWIGGADGAATIKRMKAKLGMA